MPNKDQYIKNEVNKRYYHRHKERLQVVQKYRSRADYEDPEKKSKKLEAQRKWRKAHPEQHMLLRSKYSAKSRGLEFNLSIDDIVIPTHCPVLGIELDLEQKKQNYNSPSIDRIDNNKGYIKGNIWIISTRANKLKSDGTLLELQQLVLALENLNEYLAH